MYANSDVFAPPAARASASERGAFLRKVGLFTFGGLSWSMLVSIAGAFALMLSVESMPFLLNRFVQMGAIFGSFFITQSVASKMVHGQGSSRWTGFVLGTTFQGLAMSFLMFFAALMSMQIFGNPFGLILQALGITSLMAVGMLAYLMTGPKDLSMVKGALAMLTLPMLVLMVVSFVFPIGGTLGIIMTALFVIVSAGGVLYQLNQILHTYPTNAPMPAAYSVTIGLLVLYWNVLSLVMRSNRN